MANCKSLIPFILEAEGGFVDNPADKGGATNKGITYKTWCVYFGDSEASHQRFLTMSPDDWTVVYKAEAWDKVLGDKIVSQRIAHILADWVWGSGQYYPERDAQQVIDTIVNNHIAPDGNFCDLTINAINTSDEQELYDDLIARRKQFIDNIVKEDSTQQEFHQGWINRLNNLVSYNLKFAPQNSN